jgi:hypothetical protein
MNDMNETFSALKAVHKISPDSKSGEVGLIS